MALQQDASFPVTGSVKHRAVLLASVFFLLCACSDSDEPVAPETDAGPVKAVVPVNKAEQPGINSVERCLVDNSKTPCNILEGKISQAFTPEGAQLTTENDDFAGNVGCRMYWDGGRSMEIGSASSLTVPASDELFFGAIDTVNAGAEVAARQFEAAYLAPPAAPQAAQLSALSFEPVNDLGDAAVWGGTEREKTLLVRVGATRFEVRAVLSDDAADNRASAMDLARRVIAHCQ